VHVEVAHKLASLSLLSVYDVEISDVDADADGTGPLQVRLRFDEGAWKRRRRFDGFVLLVAPPQMSGSARELVQLYRAKDAVEKDFQTIKTDLKLRPVFHHTDPKVRAHVTLCMLALLLERTLEDRLRRSKHAITAPACIEELASAHLNILQTRAESDPTYVVTEANEKQRAILRSLRMPDLISTEEVADRVHPRPTS